MKPSERIRELAEARESHPFLIGVDAKLEAVIAYLDEQHAAGQGDDSPWRECARCGAYYPAASSCSNHDAAGQVPVAAVGADAGSFSGVACPNCSAPWHHHGGNCPFNYAGHHSITAAPAPVAAPPAQPVAVEPDSDFADGPMMIIETRAHFDNAPGDVIRARAKDNGDISHWNEKMLRAECVWLSDPTPTPLTESGNEMLGGGDAEDTTSERRAQVRSLL